MLEKLQNIPPVQSARKCPNCGLKRLVEGPRIELFGTAYRKSCQENRLDKLLRDPVTERMRFEEIEMARRRSAQENRSATMYYLVVSKILDSKMDFFEKLSRMERAREILAPHLRKLV